MLLTNSVQQVGQVDLYTLGSQGDRQVAKTMLLPPDGKGKQFKLLQKLLNKRSLIFQVMSLLW